MEPVLAASAVVRSNGACEIVLAQTRRNFGRSPPIPVSGDEPKPIQTMLKQRQVIGVVRERIDGTQEIPDDFGIDLRQLGGRLDHDPLSPALAAASSMQSCSIGRTIESCSSESRSLRTR